jgi:hypothetical protein
LTTRSNSVYPIFGDAGRKWLAGANVYDPPVVGLDQYRYSPAVAAGFAPWGLLSDRPAGVLWRWLNAVVFLGAMTLWLSWRGQRENVAAALLLVIPLAVGGLNNGQCNALLAGLMLVATVAFARGCWTAAAAAMTIAVLFKGYPVALGLLFCLVEPRHFTPRLTLCLFAGFALPYLLQRPDYVTAQYASFVERLRADDRTAWPLHAGYRDLHMLLRLAGWDASLRTYRWLELLIGVGCAAVIVAGRRKGWDNRTAIGACLALCALWMTLCGPATESCTYIVLAPILAQAVLEVGNRPRPRRLTVYVSFVLFTVSAGIVWFPRWIANPVHTTGVMPLAAFLLACHVIMQYLRELLRANAGPKGPAGVNTFAVMTMIRSGRRYVGAVASPGASAEE